ncbi:MAG TPA: ketoacyl-ACP synthase III [Clostridiales bacterium]|mgnify:CR=1 FL=1|jgi:3-oxoacyl-[acyl-carrier-protein] synthase III|nr:ketoacyl-ACP synthase III [Clostridiales bacterium]HQP70494.1 ketoacyl-ACP synthase III [Clostridiales bacterium]
MTAGIKAIEYYLPEKVLSNDELSSVFPDWTPEKIFEKTGIRNRHICQDDECASDLAVKAAEKLFISGAISRKDIDFLILATQTPDYILPTTACMIQDRLGLPKTCGAFDFNLGCSAFVYGLAVSKGLISAGIARNILFITSETYSKHINPLDKSTRTIFGDGAAAVLVSEGGHILGEFDLCTDGSGYDKLIIHSGGARKAGSKDDLYMSGTDIFNFTISAVPESVGTALRKNGLNISDIDVFVFHQANKFMLDYLRKKIGILEDKFIIDIEDTGNTVSSTIPIVLKRSEEKCLIKKGYKVLICGFGVGLSWGSAVIEW